MLPPLTPFQRLQVTDGLLITADHWQQAHAYLRQRQNFHYQALNQAGIVSGLGVILAFVGTVPEGQEVDGRQIVIQPGIAIDALGNPIIVPEALSFRVQSEVRDGRTLTVYLVLNYVDPDDLSLTRGKTYVRETFRVVEKTSLDVRDVELCRIELRSGLVQLQSPQEVQFQAPGPNVLDFRFRQIAAAKPQEILRMAQIVSGRPEDLRETTQVGDRLTQLLQSVAGLAPSLLGDPIVPVLERSELGQADLSPYDIVYCPYQTLKQIDPGVRRPLVLFLRQGGVLAVTVGFETLGLQRFVAIAHDLQAALAELAREDPLREQAQLWQSLELERTAVAADIQKRLQSVPDAIADLARELGNPLSGPGTIGRDHPLRHQPFLFAQWPTLQGQPIHVLNWGGIVLIIGNIIQSWGLDDSLSLPRDTLRTAQEFGINLLHFAHQRRGVRGK